MGKLFGPIVTFLKYFVSSYFFFIGLYQENKIFLIFRRCVCVFRGKGKRCKFVNFVEIFYLLLFTRTFYSFQEEPEHQKYQIKQLLNFNVINGNLLTVINCDVVVSSPLLTVCVFSENNRNKQTDLFRIVHKVSKFKYRMN